MRSWCEIYEWNLYTAFILRIHIDARLLVRTVLQYSDSKGYTVAYGCKNSLLLETIF